ncbi:reverse transcriptase domain-containing protein [Tanacetum coccineum]
MSTVLPPSSSHLDVAELKDMVRALILDRKNQTPASARIKAQHVHHDNIQEYVSRPPAANFNKLILVCRLRYGLKSNSTPGHKSLCPTSSNPHANIKQFQSRKLTSIKTEEETISTNVRFNASGSSTASTSGSGTLPGNTVTNPKEDLKGITTRSGVTIQGPKAVNHDIEVTKDTMPPANNGSRRRPTSYCSSSIDLSFEISFTDALILMPKFASTLKTLIGNKEKLSELARTPLNENCSAVILNKLPKKLGDPGRRSFFPCEFTGITTCKRIAILVRELIPLSLPYTVRKSLSLSELTPTCMTLELADRSITEPIGIAEDVFVNVGKFQFPADFVMFMKACYLRVGKEAITFNLDQTSKYTADYNHMTVNKIDVIDMACDEYSQEVLGFSSVVASGNPTPYFEPIVSTASPTLTPFGDTNCHTILNTPFLEGDNKLPVIIAKDLKDEEKAALLKVLKSHKRAIAWKLSDIKGVSPEFCTHKILMEEDYEPSVQSQRRSILEVDRAKEKSIGSVRANLPHPSSVKGVVSFLGHAWCIDSFNTLKRKLTGNHSTNSGNPLAFYSQHEADFKQQQNEMTNKIDTVLKAITDQIAGALHSDMKIPSYSLYPCRLGDSNPFDTLADLGSCVNIIPLYLFKKLNIRLLEETDYISGSANGTKSYPVRIVNDVEVHIGKLKLLNNFYVIDLKKDPDLRWRKP